jgi:signal transduction histidine kinase
MIGISNILLEDFYAMSNEEKLNAFSRINDTAKYTHHLLENLLYWAGTQTGKIAMTKTKLDLKDILNEVVSLSSANANLKCIKLLTEIEDNSIIFADKFMIETVIRNLVSNAIKFTSKGGEVKILSKRTDSSLEVIVSDTGIGLNEDQLNALFKIDNQIKRKGTAGEQGSGLGLILCKEFVEKNNGKILIESTPIKGSRFIIRFPVSEPQATIL